MIYTMAVRLFPARGDFQGFLVVKCGQPSRSGRGVFIAGCGFQVAPARITGAASWTHTRSRKSQLEAYCLNSIGPATMGGVKVKNHRRYKVTAVAFLYCYPYFTAVTSKKSVFSAIAASLRLPDCTCRCGSGHSRGSHNARQRCRPGALIKDAPGSS